MRDRADALQTFRGQARLEYDGPDGKFKSSQMIVVEAPDRIRMDFMSPFGPTYTVAADGQSLLAYDRGEKTLYRGRTSLSNVAQYTRVPVSVEVLAALIRGLPPLLERTNAAAVTRLANGWRWTAALTGGGRLSIDFDPSGTRPFAALVEDWEFAGEMRVTFEDYEDVEGAAVPHTISAELPSGGDVELHYSRIWRSIGLTDGAFRIDAPTGVRIVDMDGGLASKRGEDEYGGLRGYSQWNASSVPRKRTFL